MSEEIREEETRPSICASAPPEDEVVVVTDPETDRYNTFGFISWWRQEVVRKATVLVVGAGALGNEVLKNLALMGVGRILIVDFDTIDASNLSRSVLYRARDRGRRKSEAAADAVRDINPDVAVEWLHLDINHDLGLGVYRRMDAILGCLDNREARLSINQACWRLGKPWVDGAIQELLGVARVFWPGRGACYECTLTDDDYRVMSLRMSCPQLALANIVQGKVPTTPTISSIIGAVQTQEALKLLHGMDVASGQALVFNGLLNDVYTMAYQEREDCSSHERYEPIVELPEARADTTTVRQLFLAAYDWLGCGVELHIPTFVTALKCKACGHESAPMVNSWRLRADAAYCPVCGEMMRIELVERVRGDEPWLHLPLCAVGIPPLAIIPAFAPDGRSCYLELSGDADTFLKFENGDTGSAHPIN